MSYSSIHEGFMDIIAADHMRRITALGTLLEAIRDAWNPELNGHRVKVLEGDIAAKDLGILTEVFTAAGYSTACHYDGGYIFFHWWKGSQEVGRAMSLADVLER